MSTGNRREMHESGAVTKCYGSGFGSVAAGFHSPAPMTYDSTMVLREMR